MLVVFGMICVVCLIIVKKVFFKVEGVSKVDVGFEKCEVVVIFDDIKVSV